MTLLSLGSLLASPVSAAEVADLVIQNVYVIKPGRQTGVDLASLRIRNGVLDLVSKDQIVAEDGERTLDADKGFLLGYLAVGAPPNFTILSKDPVADLNVLLDTKPYVVFAVDDGDLLVNDLQDVVQASQAPDEPENQRFSYEPPAFALLNSVASANKWNSWQSKCVNGLFISAIALDRQWLSQDDDSIAQFPDLAGDRERGTIRGWRFGVAGTLPAPGA